MIAWGRRAVAAWAGSFALVALLTQALGPSAARAAEADDMIVGSPLSSQERQDAWEFCVATLAQSKRDFAKPDRICGCFPPRWEVLSNHLDRLALRIALAPNGRQAHDTLGAISHIQGGLHDDKLLELSTAFKAAVRQAIESCSQ